jgi:hypothetical protein
MSRYMTTAFCLLLALCPALSPAQRQKSDPFTEFIRGLNQRIPAHPGEGYRSITGEELRDWPAIFAAFRAGSFDTARALAAKYNYTCYTIRDPKAGSSFDVLEERPPVTRGWGTFIHNRHATKRLYVDVNHPVDDQHVLALGADLFRKSQAEWLIVAGAGRRAGHGALSADPAKNKSMLFQKWHELITDLTHVTLSLHGFEKGSYRAPISGEDVVLSNGRTTDEQWGISELSLALRDTLRSAGFPAALAMYDSGYAPLAARSNPQAVFANDSVGFGHWINVELSNTVRNDPSRYAGLIDAIDRAMDLTGRKISKQINLAFGLVSPRVLRIDPTHPLRFPPSSGDTYRIISFHASGAKADTIDVRMGGLPGIAGSQRTITTITRIDPAEGTFAQRLRKSHALADDDTPTGTQTSVASGMEGDHPGESSGLDDAERDVAEPLQVHRIRLQPYMSPALVSGLSIRAALYSWNGIVGESFLPSADAFGISADGAGARREEPRNCLIPILGNPDGGGKSKYIGVRMTNMLVDEIARIVTERREPEKDVRLLAEESTDGEYYLRIFPTSATDRSGSLNGQLAFVRQ